MAIVLDGKRQADKICKDLKQAVSVLKSMKCIYPKLTIITSGDSDASKVYVNNKKKRCEEIGIDCQIIHFPNLAVYNVRELTKNISNPIIFQSPITTFTGNTDTIWKVIDGNINPELDVDGFASSSNLGKILKRGYNNCKTPCTPTGIIDLLQAYKLDNFKDKIVCIIGRSNIVGKPLFHMMEHRGATCILCHSKTPKDKIITFANMADIIVSATGVRNILRKEDFLVTSNKIFVDVGMNRNDEGKLCGDFDPEIFNDCYAYTPVPGGVGPMTVASLMLNVVKYYANSDLYKLDIGKGW